MKPSFTMNSIALRAYSMPAIWLKRFKKTLKNQFLKRCALLLVPFVLAACTTPQPPAPKAVYDFGPVLSAAPAVTPTRSAAVALPEIEASASLDSPSLLYRLQYSNAQQLLPYAQARWSSSPAQLVRARVRDALALQGPVLSLDGIAPWVLRIELDEFSQVFESPEKSFGLVRLRASLLKNDQLSAQTTVLARAPAASQDAAGGVKALTAATDDAVRQLSSWLATQVK
jgi:cholesterol transport system auxiliary component